MINLFPTSNRKKPIINSYIYNGVEETRTKPSIKPHSSGNLILHVTNVQSRAFKEFIESQITMGQISNINVGLQIIALKTKVRKHRTRSEYLIYFNVPTNYIFKFFFNSSLNVYSKQRLNHNFTWYDKSSEFENINKNQNVMGLGKVGLDKLQALIESEEEI